MSTTQNAVAAKTTSRKAAAATRYSDSPIVNMDPPVAGDVPALVAADPAKTGTGLTKAKAATKRASRAKVVTGAAAELVTAPTASLDTMAAAVNELQAAAPKGKRGKKAAAPAAPFEPVVVKDGNNHSAIAVAADEKMVSLIPMDSAGMTVTSLSRDRFNADYKVTMDGDAPYPVAKAATVYLTQTIAMDPKAKLVLETLAAAEAGKPIASGKLVDLMSRHDKEQAELRAAEAAATPGKPAKALKAEKAPKAARESKPLGHRAAPAEAAKKIVAGDTKVEAKVQPGSFRAARHNYIVSMAGKTVGDVLGASTVEGKRAIAMRDITFAVQHGFIKLV